MKRENKGRKFSQRLLSPYMVGVYLGVNAVKDFYLLVDGPDCSYMKTQYIGMNQDFYANLTNLSGFHRIGNTALHPIMMASSREEKILSALLKIAKGEFVSAVGITPMPMAAVTAVDYSRLLREVSRRYKKPTFEFKNKSLSGDWMDGYMEFGKVLASSMEIGKVRKRRRSVAIIGYLYDRNEYDNIANIAELKRVFQGIGVNVAGIWFDGGGFMDLKSVSEADLIISFGYLRDAARILSERLKTPVMEFDYPVGFEQTGDILKRVSEYFEIRDASTFIERETEAIVRRVESLIEQYLIRLRVFYCGDPILFNSIKSMLELVGMKIEYAIISNTSEKSSYVKEPIKNIIFEPSINDVFEVGLKMAREDKIDLYVGNSDMSSYFIGSGKAAVEIGFPSYFSHCIAEIPYVGYRGYMHLLNRIIKELRFAEVRKVFREQEIESFIKNKIL